MTAIGSRPLFLMLATVVLVAMLAVASPAPGAVSTSLVINEVDYDQPSTDTAEFLELKNVSASSINLDSYSVELVNGTGGGAALYQTIDLPNVSVATGDYYVICANVSTTVNCDLDVTPDTNLIQNGAPDAVGLRDGTTLIDALSYEGNAGAPYTEGSGAGLEDTAGVGEGLSRCQDGTDTGVNNADFLFGPITPGAVNDCPAPPSPAAINEIQGATHISPLVGEDVVTIGIVTAVRSIGFWMQEPDASADADPATSDGIFVFTGSAPTVTVGDAVEVTGSVSEFRPGGSSSTNLTTTQIVSPTINVLSSGNALPAPTVIGSGGRTPPTTVIDDDTVGGDVEHNSLFDPLGDGIDFHESLEGMLVAIDDAVAVGPTNDFGEIPVLAADGASAGVRTTRRGIVIRPTDFNPERLILDDALADTPAVDVRDRFPGPIEAIVDYSFGNFKYLLLAPPQATDGGLAPEVARAQRRGQLAVGSLNVENLDPSDPPAKFERLAHQVVDNLRSPDLLAVEEVQDNNGPANDSTTDATLTYETLIATIAAAGGPTYDFRQIDPIDDQDGGEPGGNIRVGFLFRSDRGLDFVDRPGGTSTSATAEDPGTPGAQLTFSPGRIEPTDPAFQNSRKPLAGEFSWRGRSLFVIANHFNSKGGDDPLFGRFQPPIRHTEAQRHTQATIVNDFVEELLAADRRAGVIVLGDLNDFEFSDTLEILEDDDLHNLMERLPQRERYSFVFEGNSQTLDQILVSRALRRADPEYDSVHVNSEFADQASDHDPQLARFELDDDDDDD
jgi:uncharacterized protein